MTCLREKERGGGRVDGVAAGCESGGLTPSDGSLVPQTVRQVPGIRDEGKEVGGGMREP